jgi:SAM-dependent methyltransferase
MVENHPHDYAMSHIYHTAWAARVIRETGPKVHVDISSSLYFSGIVSAFCPVQFYDYRPADINLTGFESGAADLLKLPFPDGSINSLSCMHVVEHVGLGRYGDPLDPNGDLKAISELQRVLAPGGNLFFVVPVGRPKVMFNAHRIYAHDQIREYFSGLELHQFSLIPDSADQGGLVYQATKEMADQQTYGCGCFWFRKK